MVYLLKILGVTEVFQTLNWFDSVEAKFKVDQTKSESNRAGMPPELRKALKNQNNLYEDDNFEEELSIRRNENQRTESRLL